MSWSCDGVMLSSCFSSGSICVHNTDTWINDDAPLGRAIAWHELDSVLAQSTSLILPSPTSPGLVSMTDASPPRNAATPRSDAVDDRILSPSTRIAAQSSSEVVSPHLAPQNRQSTLIAMDSSMDVVSAEPMDI